MAAVSRRVVLLLVVVVLTGAAAVAADSSPTGNSAPDDADTKPSILTPIAHTPIGSFEGADGPIADDAMDDDEAAPVGSPIGTTMTEPEPELAPPGPPDSSSATTAASVRGPAAAAAVASATLAAAGAIFAF
ncbi:hypothetical protein BDA96_02G112200 [Sorghum bicolor]|uniref:Uncharacterized protein n=2 Tax=Sorghum bicolor TaxID=4558 RepID=A0A921USA6_SORBI|nr:uncharacterized protein LOC8084618 [Sorghum bicolor]EER96224.1 hypothetical protein SORBI_3002G106800 [Sorghum bicolor]KAG0542529.1 hypothetical protein BDA96_02G112200 [Sorghum bicolor]|eukprot:XP_002459703.1 uncharacterized protein LOC8084618 [Sorghum bicolor]